MAPGQGIHISHPINKNWWWPALRAFNLWQCFLAPPSPKTAPVAACPLALWLRYRPLFTFRKNWLYYVSHCVIHVIECKIVSYRVVNHCTVHVLEYYSNSALGELTPEPTTRRNAISLWSHDGAWISKLAMRLTSSNCQASQSSSLNRANLPHLWS